MNTKLGKKKKERKKNFASICIIFRLWKKGIHVSLGRKDDVGWKKILFRCLTSYYMSYYENIEIYFILQNV